MHRLSISIFWGNEKPLGYAVPKWEQYITLDSYTVSYDFLAVTNTVIKSIKSGSTCCGLSLHIDGANISKPFL